MYTNKINKGIRKYIREKDITLKFYQTHSIDKAVTLLQRNRNWANGIILAPGVWSTYEAILVDTLKLIEVLTIEVYDKDGNSEYSNKSILSSVCKHKIVAPTDKMFVKGLEHLLQN